MKYFDAVVQVMIESVDGKGNPKFKRVKKNYLVDSLTVTEAEARVVKVFEQMGGVQEFNVLGVNGSKVMSAIVIEGDTDADVKFYEVAVEKIIAPETKDLKELPEGKWLTRKPEKDAETEEEETEKTETND